MKCPNHSRNEVTGYCATCGAFGCPECLKAHEGKLLCPTHYRPIAIRLEEERRREDVRRRHARQRLVVRFADGRLLCGVAFALNVKDTGFHLDLCDKNDTTTGETVQIRFSELKAVFFVRSFDGKHDKTTPPPREFPPEGSELVVKFKDGELLRGYTPQRYDQDDPRFHLIPLDPKSNNLSVLIERRAIVGVYTPEEFQEIKNQERQVSKTPEGVTTTLSQEETMGDFYFETRNYAAAIEQYTLALRKFPQTPRLRKKIASSDYNVGVQFIKRRQYPQALEQMEKVMKADPRNSHAHKKIQQLRHIIKKMADAGPVEGELEESL
ncbi:MAG: hypothetical protein HZB26_03765 [Candidatus Hydrogenedentes bacterium]|nr:hypothetical protein [Candidatus Hydrogenedentota bacterium]